MEYFILEEDNSLTNKLKINFNYLEPKEPFIVNLETSKHTQFQDYILEKNIFKYYFCISEKLYDIFCVYDNFESIPFFITDIYNKIQILYYKIDVDILDCIVDEDINNIEDIILYENKIKDKYIFKIKYKTVERIVMSIHLAENILKSLPYGIKLIPVKLK
ncbi:hypothetical protein [[Clostridium] colinum]|uniref:hypothetical protein n=1 Tax=[Clostridium] colinum TaxID=36835 RepID=UPI002024A65D|nr:hypothetical protein [[Clostridium] colinum]